MDHYTLIAYIEAHNCNPNGDPDMDNQPRQCEVTGKGLMSSQSLTFKHRRMIEIMKPETPGYEMYIQPGVKLDDKLVTNTTTTPGEETTTKSGKKTRSKDKVEHETVPLDDLKDRYFDVRAFGAVFTKSREHVRGAIQVSMAETISPITIQNHPLTRCTGQSEVQGTIGRKYFINHGLYKVIYTINPNAAGKSGLTQDDVNVFKRSFYRLFDENKASGRFLTLHHLVAFRQDRKAGIDEKTKFYVPFVLDRKIKVEVLKETPTSIDDYRFTFPESFDSVTVEHWVRNAEQV